MLQKILVVLVGLVMSLVGALTPEGLFAAESGPDDIGSAAGPVIEQTLATVRTADKAAFARIPVLWVEVDGRRVLEDAWGTGEVKEMRFKVGVKNVEGTALLVGDRQVPLEPTDVLTVRMFKGDFSFRGMGTSQATLQLQGDVKTTTVAKGPSTNRLLTQLDGSDAEQPADAGAQRPTDGRVAYVVLTTGQKLDTVALEDGGARLFTEEAVTAAESKAEPGNLLAKWVRVDGKLVREYTWGEGTLESVEFEPAEGATRSVVLAFDGETTEVKAGTRVMVKDFVGEYLIYQVAGGQVRLRLDGYAGDFRAGAQANPPPVSVGVPGGPLASFEFAPAQPRTTDTVRFRDLSTAAEGGEIVLRRWDFGDGSADVRRDPTHRFDKPGVYEVTLNVTDLDLRVSTVKRTVTILNTEPVADFEFAPKRIYSGGLVAFTDLSRDADGRVANHTWDFGDGSALSHSRHPVHRFTKGGNVSVTLTVQDDLGGVHKVSKTVVVLNTNPIAGFSHSPAAPMSRTPVYFMDNSSDSDGRVIAWEWDFGDGAKGTGLTPTHTYARPGNYLVSLTAIDDGGGSTTVTQTLIIGNQAPEADFIWSPMGGPAERPVEFRSASTDEDGRILLTLWDFGDGSPPSRDETTTHLFPRAGVYNVTIAVTDNLLATTTLTRTVTIANAAPRASFTATPDPTYRNLPVTFADTSRDPDGDVVAKRLWDFGDGTPAIDTSAVTSHAYSALGIYPVTLRVEDDRGNPASVTRAIQVVNRAPTGAFTVEPGIPFANKPIFLNATGSDVDSPGPLAYHWTFSDGTNATGQSVVKVFTVSGAQSATLRIVDGENGHSGPITRSFDVQLAFPTAVFTWTPLVPTTGEKVTFVDASTSPNGAIVNRHWEFKDGTSTETGATVEHVFTTAKTHLVSLTVRDNAGREATVTLDVRVNAKPEADFVVPGSGRPLPLGSPATFEDMSSDLEDPLKKRLTYRWDFGDGTPVLVLPAGNATHTYSDPGPKTVTLTVTDEMGASDVAQRSVDVENRRPVARWELLTTSPRVGVPVSFGSTGRAYDPDGPNDIVGWKWTFGDGRASTLADPTHTYTRSGVYLVNLQVTDGLLDSAIEPGSYKHVRVGASHAVTINVIARHPDGRPADLLLERYAMRAEVGQSAGGYAKYAKSDFSVNGTGLDLLLPAGSWLEGDQAVVYLQDRLFMTGSLQKVATLVENHGGRTTVTLLFEIPLPLVPTLAADPGAGYAMVPVNPFRNETSTEGGEPIYRIPTESFHGTGAVNFVDGTPVHKAQVTLWTRYVPLTALASAQDATGLDRLGGAGLFGWCRAGSLQTEMDGTYAWTIHGSDCLSTASKIYPVGRWEVRADATYGTAGSATTKIANVWVDPTGGNLANLPLP